MLALQSPVGLLLAYWQKYQCQLQQNAIPKSKYLEYSVVWPVWVELLGHPSLCVWVNEECICQCLTYPKYCLGH